MNNDILLVDLAKQCRELYVKVSADNSDIYGCSVLDLMADNFEASLADLKAAIIVAGIYPIANARIQAQIASYK